MKDANRKAFYANIRKDNDKHMELEYPVIKWNNGNEYAVLSNKSGKPLLHNSFNSKYPPNNIKFLREFNNVNDALDYQEFCHASEYGGIGLINDKHFAKMEKKFKR